MMVKLYFQFLLVVICLSACSSIQYTPQQPVIAKRQEITDQTFYDELEPIGRWICDTTVGYVWAPNVAADFKPYATNGRWTYTDYGWTWMSDFDWGWATFHYGRWKNDSTYGWVWAPGHGWAPAWVQWRETPDAYGWAPLEPTVDAKNISLASCEIPDKNWSFVRKQYFNDSDLNKNILPVQRNNAYASRSAIINNTVKNLNISNNDSVFFIAGPTINGVRNVSSHNIQIHNIHDFDKKGVFAEIGNIVVAYRPMVKENNDVEQISFAPKTCIAPPIAEIKPVVIIEVPRKRKAPLKKWNANNMPPKETVNKAAAITATLQRQDEVSSTKSVRE